MKNFFFAIMIMAIVSSCKDDNTNIPQPSNTNQIEVMFNNESSTRAFGSGATEAWEKSVSAATMVVFNAKGNKVYQRSLNSTEISKLATTPISLVIPGVSVGEKLDFALVTNKSVGTTIVTKAALTALIESDLASYNGTFVDVTKKAKRTGGFAMSGITQATITDGTTSVAITLKRVVAKLEVKSASTAAFASKYGNATITVTNIVVTKGNSKSYLIPNTTLHANDKAFTFTQPSSAGNNLFYVFEQPSIGVGSRIILTLNTIYDADGVSTTTGDRVPVVYTVEVAGKEGMIARNSAYLVNIKINGLTGDSVNSNITIANWATLTTQDTPVGN